MEKDIEWLLKEKYDGEKNDGFVMDCKRLESGEPLAYVIGSIPFLNTTIFLESHPLIPRTETEYWTEKAIQKIRDHKSKIRVLDLCAGSGCIGVAILKNVPNAVVDFVEIDEAHHETISKNIKENGIDISRTKIMKGNLFANVTDKYDYILSNPPYIDPALDRTEQGVKIHEPKLALYGEQGGMAYIEEIIKNAKKYLNTTGILYLEHEPEHEKPILQLATQCRLEAESFSDQFGIIRYTRFNKK